MFLLWGDLEQAFLRALNPKVEKTPDPLIRKCLRQSVDPLHQVPLLLLPFLSQRPYTKCAPMETEASMRNGPPLVEILQGWAFHESLLNSDNAWAPSLCLCLQWWRRQNQLFDPIDLNYLEFSDMFILVWNCKNTPGMIFWKGKAMESWHCHINPILSSQGSDSALFK